MPHNVAMPTGMHIESKGVRVLATETFKRTLYRFSARRMVTGHHAGYPVISKVVMEVKLVLEAASCAQLETMVDMAAVDGWKGKK